MIIDSPVRNLLFRNEKASFILTGSDLSAEKKLKKREFQFHPAPGQIRFVLFAVCLAG